MRQEFVNWFRHSAPYINTHRGRTFVIAIPGDALAPEYFSNIIHDIGLLSCLGVRLVLVHGARPQIDQRIEEAGISSRFHKHLRITDSRTLPIIQDAISAVRILFESLVSSGLPNSPLHGLRLQLVCGNFVTAMPLGVIDGVDLQHTGKVRRINTSAIESSLSAGNLVLVSPIGYSLSGEILNLQHTDVASEVARALDADKLLHLTKSRGVTENHRLVRQLDLDACSRLMESRPGGTELLRVLGSCYHAVSSGVPRAAIISYKRDGALISELYTHDGCGTMVHAGEYLQVRKARTEDIGGLIELLSPHESEGSLVHRSREMLETGIERFLLIEKDGMILSCGMLYPYTKDYGELACLATNKKYAGKGYATSILSAIERDARSQGVSNLFILTTRTAHWFVERGFREGSLAELPEARRISYNNHRNSKIFTKQISPDN